MRQEPAALWPLAIALVLIVGSIIILFNSTPVYSLFWSVLEGAAIIAVIAIWFGYGVALMAKGAIANDGQQVFTGAMVVASSLAVPYMLLLSGIFKLLTSR